ncbi:unnamed protein product (mitochondrion) [Plasmodiophora brassicae]|uniref:ABC transporter domain-containing protein n=1 Tax=Plasmodiophora brassicae TaxID=37360 RepID=A0A0G4IM98_PLABS|nr:hypothetical protein PBRA_004888 [Plasmodiophora brassicae]SPQ99151.1 unnamed protein product [Plasmodiophora brassicae]
MVGAVCRIVSLLVVLVGAVACGKRLSSCAPAQLTCRNGGYVLEKDCHGRLPGKCKKEEFGIVTKCTCRPGYYGRDCSLHLEATRTCPRGTVYSNDGLSMQGMQRSICSVQYSQAFDNPLIKFRDHSIDVEVDPGHKRVKLSILTRSTSCTTMFNMFTCEATDCELQRLDKTDTYKMACPSKKCTTCMDSADRAVRKACPMIAVNGLNYWQNQGLPMDYVFELLPNGQYIVRLELSQLPGIGSLAMAADCLAGGCITTYPPDVVVSIGGTVSSGPNSNTVFTIIAFAIVSAVAVVSVALARAVHGVSEELKTTPSLVEETANKAGALLPRAVLSSVGLFWRNLSFTVQGHWLTGARRRQLLSSSSGQIRPGQLCALIGRSGCGKSTLLRMLYQRGDGDDSVGFVHYDDNGDVRREAISYVPQDDVLLPGLTVWETVEFAARTRLGEKDVRQHVSNALRALGLVAVRGTLAGSLSGGERRRLTLASEIVAYPRIMLLDEACSGLDSQRASDVVDLLREAAHGTSASILITIHQPAAHMFGRFDQVMLMGSHGRMVFSGSPCEALSFCARHTQTTVLPGVNPFEFIVEALDDDHVLESMSAEYLNSSKSDLCQMSPHPTPPRSIPVSLPFHRQLWLLMQRSFRNSARQPRHLLLYYLVTVGVALCLGLTFARLDFRLSSGAQSRFGFFSCAVLFLSLTTLSALDMLSVMREVYRREIAQRQYTPAACFVAHLLSDLVPYRLLPAFLFSLITYPMVGLQESPQRILMFTGVLELTSLAAGASTTLIAMLWDGEKASLAALVYYLTNLGLGSSLVSRARTSGLGYLRYISFFNYATEALAAIEFDGIQIVNDSPVMDDATMMMDGDAFLAQTGMSVKNLRFDVVMLAVMAVVIYALAYAVMRWGGSRRARSAGCWRENDIEP